MATRSLIGILRDDGTVPAIYCHWDGYLSYNGALLLQHYTDIEKIMQLIELGDISALCEHITPLQIKAVPRYNFDGGDMSPTCHSFNHPHPDVTVAYHRDRGDKMVRRKYISEKQFYRQRSYDMPYIYLFKDGKWYVNGRELTEESIKTDEES